MIFFFADICGFFLLSWDETKNPLSCGPRGRARAFSFKEKVQAHRRCRFWRVISTKNQWCLVAPRGASWRLVAPGGASWRLLAPPGASWCFLAPPGASWRFLVLPGASWCLLVPADASWRVLVPPCASFLVSPGGQHYKRGGAVTHPLALPLPTSACCCALRSSAIRRKDEHVCARICNRAASVVRV